MPIGTNAVLDISHHNGDIDFRALQKAGIVGVIQKATQGQAGRDPTYKANRDEATAAGLLWGAYHFATGSDGVKQAENFLDAVGNTDRVVLVLDFEPNPTGPSMSLEEARAFVTHVYQKVGRYPGFYSGHYIKQLLGTASDPILSRCWFWLAQYGSTAVVPPNWPHWTLWQYTDGALGPEPHLVAGRRFDRDTFNGTEAELRAFWGT